MKVLGNDSDEKSGYESQVIGETRTERELRRLREADQVDADEINIGHDPDFDNMFDSDFRPLPPSNQ